MYTQEPLESFPPTLPTNPRDLQLLMDQPMDLPLSSLSSLKNFPADRTNLPNSLPGCLLYVHLVSHESNEQKSLWWRRPAKLHQNVRLPSWNFSSKYTSALTRQMQPIITDSSVRDFMVCSGRKLRDSTPIHVKPQRKTAAKCRNCDERCTLRIKIVCKQRRVWSRSVFVGRVEMTGREVGRGLGRTGSDRWKNPIGPTRTINRTRNSRCLSTRFAPTRASCTNFYFYRWIDAIGRSHIDGGNSKSLELIVESWMTTILTTGKVASFWFLIIKWVELRESVAII